MAPLRDGESVMTPPLPPPPLPPPPPPTKREKQKVTDDISTLVKYL